MPLPFPVQSAVSAAVDKRFPGYSAGKLEDQSVLEEAYQVSQQEQAKARGATEVTTAFLGTACSSTFQPYVEATMMAEHPTILGQVAKTVATGILLALGHDPRTGANLDGHRYCSRAQNKGWTSKPAGADIIHPDHDGRLTCETVVGAILMSRQPLI